MNDLEDQLYELQKRYERKLTPTEKIEILTKITTLQNKISDEKMKKLTVFDIYCM